MDHLPLYEQLVWDALPQDGVASTGDSLSVDGVMCAMVKDDRVVFLFDENRAAELVAQNLGTIYQGNNTRDWLVVDPDVDEATFRELFNEATADRNVPRAAIATFVREISAEIRSLPQLSEPDWDTYSMVADVSDGFVKVLAFRYGESGPPMPTAVPERDELFRNLHAKTFAANGRPWDVVLVKLGRDTTNVRLTFLSGRDADPWRVDPEHTALALLAESLRFLPGERPQQDNDPSATVADLTRTIASDILALAELDDPEWDTFSLVAEVADDRCATTAYRYTESGPPVPTEPPENDDLYEQLRDVTRGPDGEAWDVVCVKIRRDTASLVMDFASGESAQRWRVKPLNIAQLPELLRPRPEDFGERADVQDLVELVDVSTAANSSAALRLPMPVHFNEDVNLVIGERTTTTPPAAAWPEVSRHRYAVWVGMAIEGGTGLLVRACGSDPEAKAITYEVIGVVRLSKVHRRADGGYQARVQTIPLPPAGDLDGLISREDLTDLLRRAADRDPAVVSGWRRPVMRAPLEVAELAFGAVAEDLLRRLPMSLSKRIEAMVRPERVRFQSLLNQLREIADGTPPEPEKAQRLDRPLIDLPPHGIPVLPNDIWLTPGNVSTITASAFISDKALAAGWLAFTADLTLGRAAMATRPVRRSDTVNAGGFYDLTVDQIRPAIVRAVLPGEAGRSLVELAPAPSAAEAAGQGLPEPEAEREQLSAYLELLHRAYARDSRVVGTATGSAYRLWQASRFTSLRALLSWQIGQLGFGAQAVLDLQAIAWPDRLQALTLVLRGVADGRPLATVTAEAAGIAAAALQYR
ncbi:MAG: hypothetical protein QM650_05055 [Microlunatus sp.]